MTFAERGAAPVVIKRTFPPRRTCKFKKIYSRISANGLGFLLHPRWPLQRGSTVYSFFEKGCQEKCTRQSWKALWVVLSSLFFQRNVKELARKGHGMCSRVLKERKKVGSTATVVRNSVLIISHITFRDCRVHNFSDNLSQNSCIACITKIYLTI